jgi:hypothetical protein
MPPPNAPSSLDELFTLLEENILICHDFRDGLTEMTIRKIGVEEFELRVSSFRGSLRCSYANINSYLQQPWGDTQSPVLIHRDHFKVQLAKILPIGYGSLSLDFSKCKKGNYRPIFGCTVTEVLNHY